MATKKTKPDAARVVAQITNDPLLGTLRIVRTQQHKFVRFICESKKLDALGGVRWQSESSWEKSSTSSFDARILWAILVQLAAKGS